MVGESLGVLPLQIGPEGVGLIGIALLVVVGIAVLSKLTAIATRIAIRVIVIVVGVALVLWLLGQIGVTVPGFA